MVIPRKSRNAKSKLNRGLDGFWRKARSLTFESLEGRQLLTINGWGSLLASSDPSLPTAQPTIQEWRSSIQVPFANMAASGLTPAQIRHAYGFDQITFNNGAVVGDGTGQTIAIVDAYDDPNIVSDLAAFDAFFGIAAPPSFVRVNQNGGAIQPNAPGVDPTGPGQINWETETALDVEWAHALAPGASILLVEANSNGLADLISSAVNTARNTPNVAVVSMSFGVSEVFFETAYDSSFTTPASHVGVTFVASTGDHGSPGLFPAYSPNVLAVGGTTLSLDGNNNIAGESGWGGSGGGISAFEPQPSYQNPLAASFSTVNRVISDVSFDANPASGVPIYDSYNGGASPWFQVGGTSFSAPAWASLIAIADQGRNLAGLPLLGGATSATLPAIYALSSSDFNDVTSGSNGGFSAGPGYDPVTGRGSPKANLVASDLVGVSPVNHPPVVDLNGTSAGSGNTSTWSGSPVKIAPVGTVTDADNTNLTKMTVTFNGAHDANDVLALGTPVAGITPVYNSSTGMLTLSGTVSVASYQTALANVTYTNTTALTHADETVNVLAYDLVTNSATAVGTIHIAYVSPANSTVAALNIYYRHSFFDNPANDPGNLNDDTAIATDKSALLPNNVKSTFANYTTYNKGINGLMVDLTSGGNHAAMTAADFTFKMSAQGTSGQSSDPTDGSWIAAPTPTVVFRAAGSPVPSQLSYPSNNLPNDRIELYWADGSIVDRWLEVIVKADPSTGLAAQKVFFYGNMPGDTNNDPTGDFKTIDAIDQNNIKVAATNINNTGLYFNYPLATAISNIWDINRDGDVNSTDQLAARYFSFSPYGALQMISVPANGPFAPVGGNAAVVSALSATTTASSNSAGHWVANRLASLEINNGSTASSFGQLAVDDSSGTSSPTGSSFHAGSGSDAGSVGDELLDALVA